MLQPQLCRKMSINSMLLLYDAHANTPFLHQPDERSMTLLQETGKTSQDARQEDQVGSGSVVTPHGAVEVNAGPMSMGVCV
jgi:hypothetical protein